MDLLLDVSWGSSHLSYSCLKHLKADLQLLHLVDPWHLLNPQEQDYFFFSSSVHHTYSRLDYLLIYHQALPRVLAASIDVISLSDHAPVLTLQLGAFSYSPPSWRLNDALLQSTESHSTLQTTLTEYFSINR